MCELPATPALVRQYEARVDRAGLGCRWAGVIPMRRILITGAVIGWGVLLAAGPASAVPTFRWVTAGSTDAHAPVNACAPSPYQGSLLRPAISADGRKVAFRSNAAVIAGTPGGADQIYLRDVRRGTTVLLSVGIDGAPGNGPSQGVSMTRDGRYVAFSSCATNLVTGGGANDAVPQTYLRDVARGTTEVISVNDAGERADAGWVATTPGSGETSISADGRVVAFVSLADNLVPGDQPANPDGSPGAGVQDVFVRDRVAGTTRRVSVASDGTPGNGWSDRPALSADGRDVAYESLSSNLAPDINPASSDLRTGWDVFLRDRVRSRTTIISVASDGAQRPGTSRRPVISASGRFVAFRSDAALTPDDANDPAGQPGNPDIFVRDRRYKATFLVSRNAAGQQPQTGEDANGPSISADGHRIAFYTKGGLVPEDTNGLSDVYVRDWVADTLRLVSLRSDGTIAPAPADPTQLLRSFDPIITPSGELVAFQSSAQLTVFDTNGIQDVYEEG